MGFEDAAREAGGILGPVAFYFLLCIIGLLGYIAYGWREERKKWAGERQELRDDISKLGGLHDEMAKFQRDTLVGLVAETKTELRGYSDSFRSVEAVLKELRDMILRMQTDRRDWSGAIAREESIHDDS